MSEPSIFFSEVNERQGVFHRRAFLMGGFIGVGLLGMGSRLAHLQLVDAQRYEKLSVSNQFNFRLVPPPRGLIVDRNGVVLASNRPNFRLLVSRDKDLDPQATLKVLANFVPLDDARQTRLAKDIARAPKRTPVSVMEDMTWDQFSAINVRAPDLPGVTADMGEVRVYPHGGAFAHVIGYVAKVNKEDLATTGPNSDPILLHPGFRIGRQGVEEAFDLDLRGKPGAQKVEVDANGREVRQASDGDIPTTPGKTLQLSLDADIQNRALEVFGEASGAAVMLDCRTGDVLCMASAPSFDANLFVRGLSGAEYRALAGYERKPLLDKALSGTYPPGSTFKTMTAMAALEAGVNPESRVNCPGGWYFGGRYFHCWKKDGHGLQTMHDAIKNSCDVYFYQTALNIGPDIIAKVGRAFGLGQVYDIGIPGQKKGIVPDRAWKKRAYKDPGQQVWYPGETPSFGIGQGALAVNALQLAVMVSRLANGRKALNPRLVKSVGGVELPLGVDAPDLPFKPEHIAYVRAGMAAVANDVGGGAFRQSQLGLGEVKMAGKTGTAQVRSFDKGSRSDVGMPWKLKAHNLFVAFAPYDDPRYAMSLIVQHGGGSGATEAAPRAREIMRVALLKDPEIRARIEKPLPMPEMTASGGDGEGAAPDDPTPATGAPA
jgi:penicillin-binding protein 2